MSSGKCPVGSALRIATRDTRWSTRDCRANRPGREWVVTTRAPHQRHRSGAHGGRRGVARSAHVRARHLRAAERSAGVLPLRRAQRRDPRRGDHGARGQAPRPRDRLLRASGAASPRRAARRARQARLPVPVGEGGTLRVELNNTERACCRRACGSATTTPGSWPSRCNLAQDGQEVTVVSKDLPMRVKAASLGISARGVPRGAGGGLRLDRHRDDRRLGRRHGRAVRERDRHRATTCAGCPSTPDSSSTPSAARHWGG